MQGKWIILPLFFFISILFSDDGFKHESNGIFNTISQIVLTNYRGNSNYSISRCPFKTSCSNSFEKSVNEKGLLIGTLEFIDRYYYREHKYIYYYYPLFIDKYNQVKLNDDINYNLWHFLNY